MSHPRGTSPHPTNLVQAGLWLGGYPLRDLIRATGLRRLQFPQLRAQPHPPGLADWLLSE